MEGEPREIELKLRIPPAAVPKLMRHPALAGARRSRSRRSRLWSVYFDSLDHALAREGIALRLRKAGRTWVQTVKGPRSEASAGGLVAREELEWALPSSSAPPPIEVGKLAASPYRRPVEKALRNGPLEPRFVTDFVRTTVPLAFPDGTLATMCVDVGEVRTGTGRNPPREPIAEVELELESGSPARLFDLALALAEDLPLAVETRNKAERGYALLSPQAGKPAHAEDLHFQGSTSAAAVFAAILRNCLRQVESNADGLIADDQPEWVHQMRIGVRRLRSALSLLRRAVPPQSIGHLQDDLSWLAGALGPARDLDVFLTESLPAIASAGRHARVTPALASSLAELAARARARLAEARGDARSAVRSRRFQRLLLAAGGFAATPGLGAGAAEAAGLDAPAERLAAALLKRRDRRLREAGEDLGDLSPGERHDVRIAAKKLRYATEFFAPLFPGKRTRGYRKALARLQGELGVLNDAAVAAALANELASPAAPAAAMFAGWAAAQGEAHAAPLANAWQAFRRAKPFWDAR